APVSTPLYTLRPHRGSDTPIIFTSHHAQYVKQWGWNAAFMTVVSDILTSYATCHDPAIERFWVAERNSDGEFLGCVMLIDMSTRETARLRVLYVSPLARGMGLGRALVHTTTEFAQQAGYRKVQLSTCTRQEAALRIYDEEGYRIVSEVEDESFGPSLRHLVLELEL
ncbi:putative GNAT family N-acetyltransferase, partial [Melanomma pulvis-pyrius CBS 109.77]